MTKHKAYTVKIVFINETISSTNCDCVAGSGAEAACASMSALILFGLQHYGSTICFQYGSTISLPFVYQLESYGTLFLSQRLVLNDTAAHNNKLPFSPTKFN